MKLIIIFFYIARAIDCLPANKNTDNLAGLLNQQLDKKYPQQPHQAQVDDGKDVLASIKVLRDSIDKENNKSRKDFQRDMLARPNEIYGFKCNQNIASATFCSLKQAIELGQIGKGCVPDDIRKTKIRSISKQVSKELFITPNLNITVLCVPQSNGNNILQVCRNQIIDNSRHVHYHGFYDIQTDSHLSSGSFCGTSTDKYN